MGYEDLLDELNESELLLFAQEHDPNAHRGLSAELLVRISLGEPSNLPDRHIDKIRLEIMKFVDDNFTQVEPLVQGCPAKTRDLRACFQCTDIQVVECALSNPIVFQAKKEGHQ